MNKTFKTVFVGAAVSFAAFRLAASDSWYDAAQILQEEQTATYVFTYNKKKLCLVFDSYPLQEWQWHVKRLTEDQLWVEYAENDTLNYRIEFIKLKK